MEQKLCRGVDSLRAIWTELAPQKLLLVCGRSFDRLQARGAILPENVETLRFSDFAPNPLYEDVQKGVTLLREENCDAILAVGGGSAIDMAKCIKLFSGAKAPLIAMPTTAGTGSESTRHAVIYRCGVKQSVSDACIIPNYAVLEPSVLAGLPLYQKKCTMLDALCQGIESWWSVNSTAESMSFSRQTVKGIADHWREYIENAAADAAERVMEAANASGRAINITATTAPHAMSYKLTSLYGLPHGHAVALCMGEVWPYLLSHTDACADPRGRAHLERVLDEIEGVFSFNAFTSMLSALDMARPTAQNRDTELGTLVDSVNPERLKNNPVALTAETLRAMYERILQ